jgi:hypothetical protein
MQYRIVMQEVQSAIWGKNRKNLSILTHKGDFTKLPLSFLVINNLTKH